MTTHQLTFLARVIAYGADAVCYAVGGNQDYVKPSRASWTTFKHTRIHMTDESILATKPWPVRGELLYHIPPGNSTGKTRLTPPPLEPSLELGSQPSWEYRKQMAEAEARYTAAVYRAQAEMAQAEVRLLRAQFTWVSKVMIGWRRLLQRVRGLV